jgi:uncharacterized protein YbjT (DUF2867 family)
VIGGSGFIGSKVVPKLYERGHETISASPNSGVNTLTGEGLAQVLEGASVAEGMVLRGQAGLQHEAQIFR